MGLFQSDKEVADAPFQNSKTGAGDIRYKDQNGDNKIDANDLCRFREIRILIFCMA